jgi:pteridine reductase
MENQLKGKWVLITGGAQRVGAEIARHLAKRGMNIIVHYFTSAGPAQELKEELEGYGVQVKLIGGDLTAPGFVETLFEKFSKENFPYAFLNNAAVYNQNDKGGNIATNKDVPQLIRKLAIEKALAWGLPVVVVFYADAWLERGHNYGAALTEYAESKLWISDAVKKDAELGHKGIRVFAIANGAIVPPSSIDEQGIADIAAQIPVPENEKNRWLGAEVVARTTEFGLRTTAINASVIYVDAGRGAGSTGLEAPKEH